MMVRRKVLAPHAELGVGLTGGECSHISCPPHALLAVSLSEGKCWHSLYLPHILSLSCAQPRSREKGVRFMQISKAMQSPTNRWFKRDLPCYFWRKSNQNVGVDTPAE